ncbi:biotin transporter BioY [Fulvimarina sp. 2208YS6-2-32]|uniref:Biotin transporter n=1 Tax=Fulvimarina uroteuthidis TaxID=3098149 RepID=A0ABU5I274_9HYPH|nr:biotin transporter BioY [Fulvimarina sp. 2208YS6-2-32]MDY8109470.1 biotin transporter BioY [Fulvimarina sp. 2208YS6-2-32]
MTTRDIVFIALFAAFMAVLGVFPPLLIPGLGIPITAQSLGPMILGGVLGAKRGTLAMLLFLALVAVGLPLLSGGRGGLAPFVGPWSGFIYGWIAATFLIGLLTERFWRKINLVSAFLISVAGGIGVVYLIGVPWFSFVSGTGLAEAFMGSMIAFIPGDLVKAGIAAAAVTLVKTSYPLISPRLDNRAR